MQFLEQHDLPRGVMVQLAHGLWGWETTGWDEERKDGWAHAAGLQRRSKAWLLAEARRLAPACFDAGQADGPGDGSGSSLSDAGGVSEADDEGSGYEQTRHERKRARMKTRRPGQEPADADNLRRPPGLPRPQPAAQHAWRVPGRFDVLLDAFDSDDGVAPAPSRGPPAGGGAGPAARGGGGVP